MRSTLSLLLLLSAVACSAGPPVRYYTLAPAPRSPLEAAELRLGVLPFVVEAPYDDSRLVFRVGPETPRVDYYAYHRWAAPLDRQVASLVAGELAGRVPGHLVEVAFPGREYTALVYGRVLRLEEVDHAGAIETLAIVEIELRSPEGDVWRVERIEARQQASTASVDEVVRMMRRSIGEAVDRALPGLVATLGERGGRESGEGR